jgi:hypothetical protein
MPTQTSVVLDLKRGAVGEAVGRFRTGNSRVLVWFCMALTAMAVTSTKWLVRCRAPSCCIGSFKNEQPRLLLGVEVRLLTPGNLPPRFSRKRN